MPSLPARAVGLLAVLFGLAASAADGPASPAAGKPVQVEVHVPEHPFLLYRAGELDGLRRKFNAAPFAAYRKRLLDAGEELLALENGSAKKIYEKEQHLGPLATLLGCALFTGEERFRTKALEVARLECAFMFDLKHYQEEFNLMKAATVALVYDAWRSELSAEDRQALEGYLDRALEIFFPIHKKGGTWGFSNNIGAVFYGASGLVALARWNENPRAREALETAAQGLRLFIGHSLQPHADGAYPEGSLYWDFGLTWYLAFADMLQRATGDARGLLEPELFRNNWRFAQALLSSDGLMLTFGDTQPWLTGGALCAYLGARYDQPFMRWLADHEAREQSRADGSRVNCRDLFMLLAFLWRDERPAPEAAPALPTLTLLDSVQWGVLRSEGVQRPALELAVKGNPARRLPHAQPDGGSFVLQAGGEAFLIDPGYYQPESACHSLPLLDGAGVDFSRRVAVSGWEQGERRGLDADASAAYAAAKPERVLRHFVMAGAKAVVLLDEIVPAAGRPGKVVSNFQCGFPAEWDAARGVGFVRGARQRLALSFSGPEAKVQASGPKDFGKSWIFKKSGVAWHTLSATYTADPAKPLVAVFAPCPLQGEAPVIEVRRDPDLISVSLGGQPLARFEKGAQGWAAGH